MNVLYPSEALEDAEEITKIISSNNIQNEANNPSDEFLQFLHFNISFIVDLYLQKDQQYDPNFYLNAESIFKSNCDDIKIIMSTNEKLLNIFFDFLYRESKKTSYLVRGRFCRLLGQVLLLSDIDYTSHITKYRKSTVFFNGKSELRNCGGILFLMLLVSNIQYLPFFDLIYDIIKSHTYSALTFFEENFFTQILLNKLATTNKNSIISSLYSPITFSDEKTQQDLNETPENPSKTTIEIDQIDKSDDDSIFSRIINKNVLKILMYLTCNLSRSSSLVIPLLKKDTILTLLDASLNESEFHIFSAFQLITSLHKQSNQVSREAIEAINSRLPKICESIMVKKSNEASEIRPKMTNDDIALISLFSSIINDTYGVAGESIPEPINYRMKKSVHLADSLELFNIRQKARIKGLSVSKSQESYYNTIDEQFDICGEEEEEEEEGEWLYGEFDTSGNGGSNVEEENEVPMNLTEFTRKKYPSIQGKLTDNNEEFNNNIDNKNEINEINQTEKVEINNNNENNNNISDQLEKRKNIPHIPNFSKVTHSHPHHKSRHSTSILTYKDLNVSSHSGSNSGRIYKKQSDNFSYKNAGIINISKGFTASSGCGRLSIRQHPNNNSNENFYQKVSWMSNENRQMPKTEDDRFVITPTSSSSSSSRLELPRLEIKGALNQIKEEDDDEKAVSTPTAIKSQQQSFQKQQIQQIQQHIQYNYSFSDSHIIHAPESEVSPVTKDPTTGENLSLMDFANQAPSNPQIDLIFHQRTKSCNSIDYMNNNNNNNNSNSNNNSSGMANNEYSFSNDPVEDENISLLDLANSINSNKQAKNSLPMYNGQYGTPPVSDLYPLLQSTPVFFNNALSPRESSSSIQSYSSRTDLGKESIEAIQTTPKKSNDYTSSFNSTNSASFSNSNSSDIDAVQTPSITTISETEPEQEQEQKNEQKEEEKIKDEKDVLCSFPTSSSSSKNCNQLTSLNLQNLSNTIGNIAVSNSFTVSSGLSNRSRKSLSNICQNFGNLDFIDEKFNNGLNLDQNGYHYPNSARTTRPTFLPSACFTIQEDPTEMTSPVAESNPTDSENEEEEVGEEDEEESEAELPEDSLKTINEDEETDQIQTENENNLNENEKTNEIINEEIENNEANNNTENNNNNNTQNELNNEINNENKSNCSSARSSPSKPKNKGRILNVSKKKTDLIIQTTCFLIDQFFANPNNSFLHNAVTDLIKTFYRFTRLTPVIFNRSKILHKIIDLYKNDISTNKPFAGHIHKFSEIAQKLNLKMSKYVRKKKRSKPKEFLIFESDDWLDYLEKVYEVENDITKKNYGGFYPELYLIMKDSKERVLRPDL